MAALENPGSYLILISIVFVVVTVLYTIQIDRSWQTLLYGVLVLLGATFIILSISDIRTAIGLTSPLEAVLARPPALSTVTLGGTLLCLAGAMGVLWWSHHASQ